MKKLLFLIIILFPSISFAGGDNWFSNLNEKCLAANYTTHNEGLILKHINGRITKTENFVRYDRYIYMVANTFTDDYKFLGSYLMQYDCDTMSKKILSPLLKKGLKGELGKIEYFWQSNLLAITHLSSSYNSYWIYDLDIGKFRSIQTARIKAPKGKYIWITPNFNSYDGVWIELEVLYYTKQRNPNGWINSIYENWWNPDILYYIFR